MLTPNSDWGGEGSLGCGIGYGYLHRIPERDDLQKPVDPEVGVAVDVPDGDQGKSAPPTAAGEGYADVNSNIIQTLLLFT